MSMVNKNKTTRPKLSQLLAHMPNPQGQRKTKASMPKVSPTQNQQHAKPTAQGVVPELTPEIVAELVGKLDKGEITLLSIKENNTLSLADACSEPRIANAKKHFPGRGSDLQRWLVHPLATPRQIAHTSTMKVGSTSDTFPAAGTNDPSLTNTRTCTFQ